MSTMTGFVGRDRPAPGASGLGPRCPILVHRALARRVASSTSSSSRGWTLYISLSNSTLLPSYGFVGLENYVSLWQNRRWNSPYTNLFFFSGFYIVGAMALGLLLAILIDQKVRGEVALAHDLPLSAGRQLHRHRHGLELALQSRQRHPVLRPQPRLDRLRVRADQRPADRDLRRHHHRHLAIVGLRDGAVPRRPPVGRPATSSRRRRSTAPRPSAPTARWSCRRSRRSSSPSRWCRSSSPSRPSTSSPR